MKAELNLKIIDTPEKAFLIGLANCQALHYWKSSKEFLAQNILPIELPIYNSEYAKSYDWFNNKFKDYIESIFYKNNKIGHTWLHVNIWITLESIDNLQCKYIPIKKSLYDYYIRGLFYLHAFEENVPFIKSNRDPFYIIGPIQLVETLSKKLNDYYNLTDFEIEYYKLPNPMNFAILKYMKTEKNIEYFKNIWWNSSDLFDSLNN